MRSAAGEEERLRVIWLLVPRDSAVGRVSWPSWRVIARSVLFAYAATLALSPPPKGRAMRCTVPAKGCKPQASVETGDNGVSALAQACPPLAYQPRLAERPQALSVCAGHERVR